MIVVTTAIHAIGMVLVMQVYESQKSPPTRRLRRIFLVSVVVVMMSIASLLEMLIWAITLLSLNAIQGFEKALYFSMVTFTTLGYGDIVLSEQWRLLGSFEATNGIIMFGWTTAIVIAAVQRIYFSKESKDQLVDSANKQ
jgi:voltage-gated potassium channel Kch